MRTEKEVLAKSKRLQTNICVRDEERGRSVGAVEPE
jgi:hypothetical protein